MHISFQINQGGLFQLDRDEDAELLKLRENPPPVKQHQHKKKGKGGPKAKDVKEKVKTDKVSKSKKKAAEQGPVEKADLKRNGDDPEQDAAGKASKNINRGASSDEL